MMLCSLVSKDGQVNSLTSPLEIYLPGAPSLPHNGNRSRRGVQEPGDGLQPLCILVGHTNPTRCLASILNNNLYQWIRGWQLYGLEYKGWY
ncbi:hypothetical protein PAXRUDRAFT_834092 [Paxillus rubicundulus Ve08.2h10]|uniref:Uncharacterized protein n=1 Tax=Paxillus rubicundulus Ve08.2h10 TaxID=930991 RepID=A0A0D0C993_9AGAM|nr:hypothetical protein PAXRUDRAFT_834092 [Paxillus rubicundulus Ve08.2h10]